jgi:hypothetical protein
MLRFSSGRLTRDKQLRHTQDVVSIVVEICKLRI